MLARADGATLPVGIIPQGTGNSMAMDFKASYTSSTQQLSLRNNSLNKKSESEKLYLLKTGGLMVLLRSLSNILICGLWGFATGDREPRRPCSGVPSGD